MLTPAQCIARYGQPAGANEGAYMATWSVPEDIVRAFAHVVFALTGKRGFPAKIYCHKLLASRLELALRGLMKAGLAQEMKTWDGCYVVRRMRGLKSWSLHSWGLAVDVNRKENELGEKPKLSAGFVQCFKVAGFDWGGNFRRLDGMHFQLQSL